MVWKPPKNACLNWCASQFAYLNLIILTMPIKLSDHSNIPTIWLSDCLTIRPFWSFRLSDFPTIQLFSYLTCPTVQPFQLSDFPAILTVQIFHHLTIPIILISLSENFHFNWPNLSATGLNIQCEVSPSDKSDNWIFNSDQPNPSGAVLNIKCRMGPPD